jgi:hypothetical protein
LQDIPARRLSKLYLSSISSSILPQKITQFLQPTHLPSPLRTERVQIQVVSISDAGIYQLKLSEIGWWTNENHGGDYKWWMACPQINESTLVLTHAYRVKAGNRMLRTYSFEFCPWYGSDLCKPVIVTLDDESSTATLAPIPTYSF